MEGLTYHCFNCYGTNSTGSGLCRHCGREIAPPPEASYDDRLVWTLHHPDPDRAITAARILGDRGATSAAGALKEVVRDPPDPYLAVQALRSLIRIEGVGEIRDLLEEVADADSFLPARVAADALRGLDSD
jgi:hypothetical protein